MESEERLPRKIWQMMSEVEKQELLMCQLAGTGSYDAEGNITIMMGMAGFRRIREYEDKMIAKYDGCLPIRDKLTLR